MRLFYILAPISESKKVNSLSSYILKSHNFLFFVLNEIAVEVAVTAEAIDGHSLFTQELICFFNPLLTLNLMSNEPSMHFGVKTN